MVSEEMKTFCHQVMDYRLPRWKELPEFDIYMDQLITLVRKYLSVLFEEEDAVITSSMINNYVKAGLIPKPEKKRYNAQHIASLIVITLMKQMLSISQIKEGIQFQLEKLGPQEAYDRFCEEQELALQMVAAQVLGQQCEQSLRERHTDQLAVQLVTMSFASALTARKMLALRKQQPKTDAD